MSIVDKVNEIDLDDAVEKLELAVRVLRSLRSFAANMEALANELETREDITPDEVRQRTQAARISFNLVD